MIALWLALVVVIIAERPDTHLWCVIGFSACEGMLWWKGHMIGAIRPIERRYAFALPFVGLSWALYATFGGSPVSPHDGAVLIVLATLSAVPWWRHRRNRGTVPVQFHNTSRIERQVRLREVRRLMHGWTAYTSAGHIQGAKVRYLTFSKYAVAIGVRLRNGAHAGQLRTNNRRRHLESASLWPVAEGSVRVYEDNKDSRNCEIRYMLIDPHAEPIFADEEETPTIENIIIGIFETGADVLFALVNTLIAGETGAGKSGVVNRIIQALCKIPTIGLLGVDLTPGATELGPWRKVLHELANTPDEVSKLFDAVLDEMERRGRIMEQHGWKNFRCTVRDPFMVLIIDEAQRVKELRLNKKLKRIASEIRKYGGCVIVATQYPKSTSLDADITINLPQKIGMKVFSETADRVIFGGNATRQGWSPSVIIPEGREGSFLIKSKHYGKPILARAHHVPEDHVERDVERWSPQRTAIESINLRAMPTINRPEELEPGSVAVLTREEDSEIVEAEIVDNVENLILDMLDRDINTPSAIQKELEIFGESLTVRTINNHLRKFKERGIAYQTRTRGPWYRSR